MRLSAAVQDVADQAAGEDAVDRLGNRAERAGQPQPAGDRIRQFIRGRGDQPYLLARVQVHLRQRARARPDLVRDDLVKDLLADGDEFRGRPSLDERQRLAPACGDVVAVLPAGELELGLCVRESGQIAVGEVLARRQSAREVNQRRPLHERVVDVEERGSSQVRRRRRGGGVVPLDEVRNSGLRTRVACQRLYGGFLTIANGHLSTLGHRFCRYWYP